MSTVKRSSWRRPLGEEIQRHVRYKCALGHRHPIEESALRMLDRFLCERRVDLRSRGFAVRFTGMRPAHRGSSFGSDADGAQWTS